MAGRWKKRWLVPAGLCAATAALALAIRWRPAFTAISPDEPLLPISVRGRAGYVNAAGVEVLPSVWEDAREFGPCGLAAVKRNGLYGYIDRTGKMVIPCQWKVAGEFGAHNLAWVGHDYAEQFPIRPDGTAAPPGPCEFYEPINDDGLALVMKIDAKGESRWGLMDRAGGFLRPWEEGFAAHYGNGLLATYRSNRKWGVIDSSGRTVIPFEWTFLYLYEKKEPWLAAEKDGRAGFIDKQGKVVLPLEWGGVGSFNNTDLAPVQRGRKWGYIDRTGKLAIPLTFDNVAQFHPAGIALASVRARWGLIDQRGNWLLPAEYESIELFDKAGHALVCKDRQSMTPYGVADLSGRLVLKPEWQRIDRHDNGYLLAHAWGHPLLNSTAARLLRRLGWPLFDNGLVIWFDREGRPVWLSDLHELRVVLLPAAAFFSALAAVFLWLARRRATPLLVRER